MDEEKPEQTAAFWITQETMAPMGNVVVLTFLPSANCCCFGDVK